MTIFSSLLNSAAIMAAEFIPGNAAFPGLLRAGSSAAAPAEPPPEPEPESPVPPVSETYRLHRRFDRMGRLVGDGGMQRLFASHVMVVGLGGVGSWAAESLVRSGVGAITIVDFDLVCVTNANRQLHAMRGTTGKPKCDVMAERLRLINPRCEVRSERVFYNASTSEALLGASDEPSPDLVVDAIDNLNAKTHLINTCRARGIPLVVSGGASGRMDPTKIRESDLARVRDDPFLAATRKLLRKRYEFPRGDRPWGITAIHSLEPAADPISLHYDEGQGFRCVCPQGNNGMHSCDRRNVIYGTASFVTGTFGLACAAAAVRLLLAE